MTPTLHTILGNDRIHALKPGSRLRYQTPTGELRQTTASNSAQATKRARSLPAMLWPRWALQLTLPATVPSGVRPSRASPLTATQSPKWIFLETDDRYSPSPRPQFEYVYSLSHKIATSPTFMSSECSNGPVASISPDHNPLRQFTHSLTSLLILIFAVASCSSDDSNPSQDGKASPHSGTAQASLVETWKFSLESIAVGFDPPTGSLFLWYSDDMSTYSPNHFYVIDYQTGQKRWNNVPEGWDIDVDYLPRDSVVGDVLIYETDYAGTGVLLMAADVRTGTVKWKKPAQQHKQVAVTEKAVVINTSESALAALDPATGAELWTTAVPAGCSAEQVDGHGDLVVLETRCGNKLTLNSFGPTDGKTIWQVPLDAGSEPDVGPNWEVVGSMIGVWSGDQMWFYDRNGKVVVDKPSQASCNIAHCFAATESIGIVSYDGSDGPVVEGFSLADGKVLWSFKMTAKQILLADGRLYIVGRLPQPLMPNFFATVEVTTGALLVGSAGTADAELVAAGDDMLVTNQGYGDYIAYKTAPADGFYSGAPTGEWPDACSLVDAAAVKAFFGKSGAISRPSTASFLSSTLPKPASCQYGLPSLKGPTLTVSTAWTAPDTDQAAKLMRSAMNGQARSITGIGDEAIELLPGENGLNSRILFIRVGRYIARVETHNAPRQTDAVGRSAAKALRLLTP